jgi:purine-nucleoside phosphorylase
MATPKRRNETSEPDMTNAFGTAADAADAIRSATGVETHDVALILGSGWASTADQLGRVVADVELSSVAGFPAPSVPGHRDLLRSVDAHGQAILVLGGRSHLYEGHSTDIVVHGVRTAAAAGCRTLILTNAAGGLQSDWAVGQLVLIADHLNLTGRSPMVGPPPPPDQPGRFCDLTEAYSQPLRDLARDVDPSLPEGVYAGLLGGNYETPAEIRMLATQGADLVGMSTVLETIAARHLGLEVLGISLVTNPAAGLSPTPLSHSEVIDAAAEAEDRVVGLIGGILERLGAT